MRTSVITKNKNIVRVVVGTALILLIPWLAMQFSDQVNWSLLDFATIGTLLIGSGLIYELVSKRMQSTTHRIILALVLVTLVLLIWVELAVGIFGSPFAGS